MITLKCSYCGEETKKYPSAIKGSKFHYCSTKCQYKHQSVLRVGEKNPFYGKHHSVVTRNGYSKNRKGHIGWKAGKTKFTDVRIKKGAEKLKTKGLWKGEKNPNWHGIRNYNEYEKFLLSEEWSLIRKRVLERDKYKCIKCCDREELQVHHDTPYQISRDNSMDNLITLCNKCHHIIERAWRSNSLSFGYIWKMTKKGELQYLESNLIEEVI